MSKRKAADSSRAAAPKAEGDPSPSADAAAPAGRKSRARSPGRLTIKPGRDLLYLNHSDIERLPWEPGEALNHALLALREHGRGKAQMPVGVTLQPHRQALFTAAPAFVPNVQACGLKWISRFPGNLQAGLPQVSSLTVLSDPHSGFPLALIDGEWLAGQTGPAISAAAAKLLARPESATAAIIGAGVQGRGHIPALVHVLPNLTQIKVYDTSKSRLAAAVKGWRGKLGRPVRIEAVDDYLQAVRDADVLISATAYSDKPSPAVPLGWIRNGALIISLDLDNVFEPGVFHGVDRFYVDSAEELELLRRIGMFQKGLPDHVTGLLGQVAVGRLSGRGAVAERIACLNLGLGCVDIVLARAVFEKACKLGVGQVLRL